MNASREIFLPGANPGRSLENIGERAIQAADRVDVAGSVGFFRKRLRLILVVVGASLLIGALISLLAEKVYVAETVVSLEAPTENQGGANNTSVTGNTGPTPTSAFVETQVEIIKSNEMARRVADQLGLLSGMPVADQPGMLGYMQSKVDVERSGDSYALKIRYSGDTAADAAKLANEYARQFTQWELRSRRERNKDSIATIQSRLTELRTQAQADTAALQHYRIANNLLSTSGSSLTEQEISSYNQEVTRAKAEAAEDQARLNTALAQVRSGSTGEDVGEALGSGVISSLRSREAEVGGQVANLSARYGPNHPELIRTQGELAEIRSQIQAEITRVISNLQAKKQVSQQRLASLTSSLSAARGQLSQNNSAMVGLDELQRNAEVSQGLYETYLNSYKQLAAGEGTERPNARILTLAQPPAVPSSPNIPMNMLLALVIGLGAGVTAAFLAETFFAGLSTSEDIRSKTGQHFLGSVPLLSSVSKTQRHEVRAITEEPRSVFAEAFRSLATSVDQAVYGPVEVIAITSAMPNEGKTITATCLAETLVIGGASVVLVDCDHVRRGVTSLLSLEGEHPGLFQVLEGSVTLDQAMISSSGGLSIIPMGLAGEKTENLLRDGSFENLIAKLRAEFDYVILDLPPVLPVAAARVMAAQADATIMLVRWRKTALGALQSALSMMASHHINVAGVALTQVDFRRRSLFGPNDPAFYFGGYRGYYS